MQPKPYEPTRRERFLTWVVLIVFWIVISPILAGAWVYEMFSNRRVIFGDDHLTRR